MTFCNACGEFDDTRHCEWCGQWLCSGCFDTKDKVCNVCWEGEEWKTTQSNFGMPHIRKEGAPLHPDDLECDLTKEQYERQLRAYKEYFEEK